MYIRGHDKVLQIHLDVYSKTETDFLKFLKLKLYTKFFFKKGIITYLNNSSKQIKIYLNNNKIL